ncbi:MAG TPA: pantoate--beta-alanine ligase [Caulobacterales bacterium]|nr:pantoate--beta-alanine ligase [Caulobacterales bacterium]
MNDSPLPVARDVPALRAATRAWRAQGLSIGLVPTMGALHAGHVSLVRQAKAQFDKAVTSIFVNPKQFAPHEDFERYPRDEAGDAAKLAEAGCDLIFAPTPAIMYPEGFSSRVIVSRVATPLEGEMRPHFFAGVATVVTKLFLQCLPDAAFFGEKDYQQLQVVKRLVRDLDIPVEVVGCPTVRETDGLAMSSRNAYLSPHERAVAAKLNVVLKDCIEALKHGVEIAAVERAGSLQLHEAGFECIDYVAVRDAETLEPIETLERPARILAAAWLGKTRLIDNMAV